MVQLQERTVETVHATALDAARRATAALLCLGVSVIHVIDQGGIPGSKDPAYVGAGYYILEIVGVAAALLLIQSSSVLGWLLSLGVGAGPILGYILSRGPGLPDYSDDKGNWNEPLGVVSLFVEGFLLLLALVPVLTARKRTRASASA
ncbi:MAG TPA: hypothetical protein VFU65_11670 [Actinocrinis sp.]|nr:hypothetical protein [Actinocrinis sp.]